MRHTDVLSLYKWNKIHSFQNHRVRVWGPPDRGTPASVLRAVVITYCPHSPPFQGRDAAALSVQIRRSFWPALRMNWRVWTPVQFININYVPLQVRASWHHAEPEGASSSTSLVPSWNDWWFSLHAESLAALDVDGRSVSTPHPLVPETFLKSLQSRTARVFQGLSVASAWPRGSQLALRARVERWPCPAGCAAAARPALPALTSACA